ncbi:MAG: chromate transporter [bacterium]|nr:chromate transporter [bacterium]
MLLRLFLTFIRIGSFAIGGGLAMLPLIREEVVNRNGWMTDDEFLDVICLTQIVPGPIAVNASIIVGYRIAGFWGALVSAVGALSVPFIIIMLVVTTLMRFLDLPGVSRFMQGAIAGVLAIIVEVVVSLGRRIVTQPGPAVMTVIFLLLGLWLPMIYVVILAMVLGLLVYYIPGLRRYFYQEAICNLPVSTAGEVDDI